MTSSAAPHRLELVGLLATTDAYERLRLVLVDSLEDGTTDYSWNLLRSVLWGDTTPYRVHEESTDGAGIKGECWINLPPVPKSGKGREAIRARRARILALAEELRGKEVVLTVQPKRYSYAEGGEVKTGTALGFVNLSPRKWV